MSDWQAKRFWTEARVLPEDLGFVVELDGRRLKTPAKASLVMPTRDMADAVAAEWDAQVEAIDPRTMPVTQSANAALDKVQHQHSEVAGMLAAYGDTDLLCYRADGPQELVARQSAEWDPALDWAAEVLGARLLPRTGIIHDPQDPQALAALESRVHAQTHFELAAFHDLVSLSGSLVLGFAAAMDWRPIDAIWDLSRLDESWQEQQWGVDEEASANAELKRRAFQHAKRFYDFSQTKNTRN